MASTGHYLRRWGGRSPSERWPDFVLNREAPLARGLVFAGLGANPGTLKYTDSCGYRIGGIGNHGTLTGYTGAGNTPPDQWSRALGRNVLNSGTAGNGVVLSNDVIGITTITFACWVHNRSSGISTTYGRIFDNGYARLQANGTTAWNFTGNSTYLSSSAAFNLNTWKHMAITRQAETNGPAAWFVNGVADAVGNSGTPHVAASAFTFGNQAALDRTLNAKYSDPCIWTRALSPSEIAALADPSNVDLRVGGVPLILPVWRRVYGVAVAPSGNRRRRFLTSCGA